MFSLDPRTVIFINALYSFCIFIFIASAVIYRKLSIKKYRHWLIGFLLLCINFLILSLRSIIPVSIVIVFPHVLTMIAFMEIKRGLCQFYDVKNRVIGDWSILVIFTTLLVLNQTNAQLRIVTISAGVILIFLDTVILFSSRSVKEKTGNTLIPILFLIATFFMTIRLVLGVQWNAGANPMETGNSLSTISILFFISNIIIFFTLLFIVLNRILSERDDLIEKIRSLSLTDELTGLMNRRGFNNVTKYELNRFSRTNKGYTFIMGDIDHFKAVNDNYGHDCGDIVLKKISQIIMSCLRDCDTTARWGGEEFVILLPETNLENAETVLERIRMQIEEFVFDYKDETFHKTISFGAVFCDNTSSPFDDVIKVADDNLYKAKERGRNRVLISKIK